MIEIEDGIPIPKSHVPNHKNLEFSDAMDRLVKVGQSFFINKTAKQVGTLLNMRISRGEYKDKRFKVRTEKTGSRVWRVL